MPKKRTSPKSSDVGQTNDGSVSTFQHDENAKRVKRVSLNDTTFQDLPTELIECILVKAVVLEVKGMMVRLIKPEPRAYVDLVISRLSTVCLQWRSILATNFVRNELHRTLDNTVGKIHLNIAHQTPRLRCEVRNVVTMKDEVYVHYKSWEYPRGAINVYDCNNLTEVKDIIPLPKIFEDCMEACNESNCVYILHRTAVTYIRVLRIARDDNHQFNVTPFISKVWMPNTNPTLSVTAAGRLIFSRRQKHKRPVISVYNANGSLHREMKLHSHIPSCFSRIIPRPNGNLVLVSTNDQKQTVLTEIDMDATIIRQYLSSLDPVTVCKTGMYGGMLLVDRNNRIELLDSEFNVLDATSPQLQLRKLTHDPSRLHFNCERNELAAVVFDIPTHRMYMEIGSQHVAIFRFTEE